MSILLPLIAPPQSSATKVIPSLGIYTFVPYGITRGSTAITPHLGVVPVDVIVSPAYAVATTFICLPPLIFAPLDAINTFSLVPDITSFDKTFLTNFPSW